MYSFSFYVLGSFYTFGRMKPPHQSKCKNKPQWTRFWSWLQVAQHKSQIRFKITGYFVMYSIGSISLFDNRLPVTLENLFWSMFNPLDMSSVQVNSDMRLIGDIGEVIYAIYMIIVVVVMLNALIAMMSNTYDRVKVGSLAHPNMPKRTNISRNPCLNPNF